MLSNFLKQNRRSILWGSIGAALGAVAGFIYWKYVGCISGTCAIWSNPTRATLYGALLGMFALLAFVPNPSPPKKTDS